MSNNILTPYIVDVYPHKAQYMSGDEVKITVEAANPCIEEKYAAVVIKVLYLNEEVSRHEENTILKPETTKILNFLLEPPASEWKGFGVDITLIVDNIPVSSLSTAFDVVSSWKKAIRYGFLSDFYKEDENDTTDVEQMSRYHLNAVQFYDWMYRHEDLIPPEDYFLDPLNRELSLKAVRSKIEACSRHGMKSFAYGAIYAAAKGFFEEHKDWALYNNLGNAISLGDWLIIMNTSKDSPWRKHIINEYRKAVELIGFDGIHLDTYGFPKTAFSALNGCRRLEKVQEYYPDFINNTRRELEKIKRDIGLIFNAVNNWPVDNVAPAEQDAVYIEVWNPHERYIHLYQLISHARARGNKPVILAAYLKPYANVSDTNHESAENSFLLLSAVISASGGYHLILGENNGVLTEDYYVNYAVMQNEFVRVVRNYYDFIVRYANLLFGQELVDISMTYVNGINNDVIFDNSDFSSYGEPGKIWTIVKEKPGYLVISMINLSGIDSDIWNEPKITRPLPVSNISAKMLVNEDVQGIFIASPDMDNGRSKSIDFEYVDDWNGRYIKFIIPQLKIWNLVYIRTANLKDM